ncbi:hypothetical protein ES703_60523 [subsurface metagenome]
MYVVFVCYNCGRFLLAKSTQKTRRCPYCEARLTLIKTKIVYIVSAVILVTMLAFSKAFISSPLRLGFSSHFHYCKNFGLESY